jgi:ParB family chromosome partitioning protein
MEFLELNPDKLTYAAGTNVRADLRLDKPFLKSVKSNGIIQPVVAYPDPDADGLYRILFGHRRTAAAVELGLPTIPVVVVPRPEDPDRIAEQLVENIHRADLTTSEKVTAYKQLALDFGLPATTIAKKTASPMSTVGNALRVAQSDVAAKIITEYQVTVDEAIVFDEFGDDPEAIDQLAQTLTDDPAQFAHEAQLLRDERTRQLEKQAIEDELDAAGITVIDPPSYDDKTWRRADSLTIGDIKTELDEDTALAEAGDDLAGFTQLQGRYDDDGHWVQHYAKFYAVKNWRDHGWHHYSDTNRPGELSSDEKEQRRLARANGKLWASATTVRKEWVKQLLQRRTLPADWAIVPAVYAADNSELLAYRVKDDAAELLGLPAPTWESNPFTELLHRNLHQVPHFMLAVGAAAHERSVDGNQGWNTPREAFGLYLGMLASWGYTLSDLERDTMNRVTKDDDQ